MTTEPTDVFDEIGEYDSTSIFKPKVVALVVEHGRGRKLTVFKKKRRKGYRRKNGHRQAFTALRIERIA